MKDVVVLEKGKIGSGSTSACLGGFRYQFSSEISLLLSMDSIPRITGAREELGVEPYVNMNGYMFLAFSPESAWILKNMHKMLSSRGLDVDVPRREELEKKYPFYSFEGLEFATLCMMEGKADTFSILKGYVAKASSMGVRFFEDSEVVMVDRAREKYKLISKNIEFICDKVVIAAGPYSRKVGRMFGFDIPVYPHPRKILFAKSNILPREMPLIIDMDTTLAIGKEGNRFYFSSNEPTEESYSLSFPEGYDEKMIRKLVFRAPPLSDSEITGYLAGLYEMTPDANPLICRLGEDVFCCAGFSGHGFMHSPSAGQLTAELVLGKNTHIDISTLGMERFSRRLREHAVI